MPLALALALALALPSEQSAYGRWDLMVLDTTRCQYPKRLELQRGPPSAGRLQRRTGMCFL